MNKKRLRGREKERPNPDSHVLLNDSGARSSVLNVLTAIQMCM